MARLVVRVAYVLFVTTLGVTAAVGVRAQVAPTPSDPLEAQAVADKAAFDQTCSSCHDASVAEGPFRTPDEWDETLQRMESYGASATRAQFEQIRRHLMRNWGRIRVNAASAPDIAQVLNVTMEVADAVVVYRTANGRFMGMDDLAKVPGVDPVKLDARKNRLTF